MQPEQFRSGASSEANLLLGGGVGLLERAQGVQAGGDTSVPAVAFTPPAQDPWLGFARKMLLSLLGIGVIGAIVGAGTMGTASKFTASVVNSGNQFTAGTLKMDNSGSSSCTGVVASACSTLSLTSNAGMSPGDVATGTVTVKNSGTVPATMTMKASNVSSSGLESSLNFTVFDGATSTCLYGSGCTATCSSLSGVSSVTSSFANISATPVNGSTRSDHRWEPSESHTFTVCVEVISTATSAVQNLTASIDFIWAGVQ
jgi:uncharacterized repeat protein (TIGR01451 family)/predicted ribosomally synthesized peptide with SipW-like signal peptide